MASVNAPEIRKTAAVVVDTAVVRANGSALVRAVANPAPEIIRAAGITATVERGVKRSLAALAARFSVPFEKKKPMVRAHE